LNKRQVPRLRWRLNSMPWVGVRVGGRWSWSGGVATVLGHKN